MPVVSAIEPQRTSAPQKFWTPIRFLQAFLMASVWFGGMFLAAGTIRWLRGWIFAIAVLATYAVAGIYVHRKNPGLITARAKWTQCDTAPFDRVFVRVVPLFWLAMPAVAGLDTVRYRWTSMPFATVYLGLGLLACGMAFVTWAMAVNPFAERSVRIQSERHQTTVNTGPYRIVRHPMYLGALAIFPAAGFVLGSWWTLLIGLVLSLLLVWRTGMEDRFLMRELPGYPEFAAVTRYRLLPGIW